MRTATDAPEAAVVAVAEPVEEPTDEPTDCPDARPTEGPDDAAAASSAPATGTARATATARDPGRPGTDESWVARCQRQFSDADRRLPNLVDGVNQVMYDGV
ncbi:MAG: hypothetical protein ABEJ88_08300 [Halobacterium sp.]